MNIVQDKSRALEERMISFTNNIIALTKGLPKTPENKVIVEQLIKSASSVGANYTEANNAASRVDFRNKIFIAKKEAAETRYWLRILSTSNKDSDAGKLLDESSQLLFILQKIVSTLKNGKLIN